MWDKFEATQAFFVDGSNDPLLNANLTLESLGVVDSTTPTIVFTIKQINALEW